MKLLLKDLSKYIVLGRVLFRARTRYIDFWQKDKAGNWKLAMLIDNADVPDQLDVAPTT